MIFIAAVSCVETSPRSTTIFDHAVDLCARDGRRLLTSAELLAVAANHDAAASADLAMSEWAGTVVSHVSAITAGIFDDGTDSPRNFSNLFHCMTVPAIAS